MADATPVTTQVPEKEGLKDSDARESDSPIVAARRAATKGSFKRDIVRGEGKDKSVTKVEYS